MLYIALLGRPVDVVTPENPIFMTPPDPNRPPEINWDPQKHVEEFPTDAHGDMIFTRTTRTLAKYVRASSDTDPSILFELMTEQWGCMNQLSSYL
ncbi:unnamed protein product [Staurois parvus]|uniref:Uncharacterized protein n=1 Tax=Staurois parvus TaxID=386267 RepID=A0ABN9BEW8_9NEOB|nr:unnamed protein product [Staurois parvus]